METKSAPQLFVVQAATIRNDSARTFDDTCAAWSIHQEYNDLFIRAQQNHANDLLRSRGHVFLNDVYDFLGLPRTQLGAVAGWMYPGEIDFGTVAKPDNTFDLNFNIQGIIYNLLP